MGGNGPVPAALWMMYTGDDDDLVVDHRLRRARSGIEHGSE